MISCEKGATPSDPKEEGRHTFHGYGLHGLPSDQGDTIICQRHLIGRSAQIAVVNTSGSMAVEGQAVIFERVAISRVTCVSSKGMGMSRSALSWGSREARSFSEVGRLRSTHVTRSGVTPSNISNEGEPAFTIPNKYVVLDAAYDANIHGNAADRAPFVRSMSSADTLQCCSSW